MFFAPLPATATGHHRGARPTSRSCPFQAHSDRCQIKGWTAATEDGVTWAIEYTIAADASWATGSVPNPPQVDILAYA
jgi:uncharacterized protein